jgi:alkyl sulfatase BDS1-like metallo-beta-lactamase superfamily hydrolase
VSKEKMMSLTSIVGKRFAGRVSKVMFYFLSMLSLGCSDHPASQSGSDSQGHTAATAATIAANEAFAQTLPLLDQQDWKDARRGLIATPDALNIQNTNGEVVWDMPAYQFVKGPSPKSVNPSLWRQAGLNNLHGLFEVTPGIYQIRGFDLANMTLVKADNSWVIVDPLTSAETAARAFEFAMQHLERQSVSAILFTHSHIDHFGGVEGILSQLAEGERDNLRIVAPEGFVEEATSENIIAGPAMSRRAMYMYGKRLQRSERGHIGSGLGKGPAFGTFGITEPTELISETPTRLTIDGLEFVFQNVPGSEAPAEFTFYLPHYKAFCGAELVSRNLHNLYTLRGAKVRDALAWSRYIDEASQRFEQAEIYFGSHHWPVWGRDEVQSFMGKQRDIYKYIHDQSVRLMNAGYTPNEIADAIELPEALRTNFSTRGYYGTVKHNAKAVYQSYMGWFTANPAMLDPLPESDTAVRTLALMGGSDKVVAHAKTLLNEAALAGADKVNKEYRWLAQLLNTVVFAEPDNLQAKAMLAKVYDQLAYQAESAPWRDFYLSGAYELRHGAPASGISPSIMKDVLIKTPIEKFFDSMAVNLNGPEAEGESLRIEIQFSDLARRYVLILQNSVLRYQELAKDQSSDASATLTLTHPLFVDILVGDAGLKEKLFGDDLSIDGSALDLLAFFSLIEKQEGVFNIVLP